ncbi:nitroreductase family protein [Candidatus Woesearchaeota archaeon]|nr:nitroreductase family protein [Candidatus Woesearchaeota archaeon]
MDVIDTIKSRRTIKEFLPEFVSWDKISKILDAARHAPSCGNVQNWKFVVVIETEVKQQLAEAALQQYEILNAPVLIVVCAEPEKAGRYYGERGEHLFSIQNCASATQNMLLEAHSLGLGARWIGGFEEEMVKRILSLPEEVQPQVIVAIGHPKEVPAKPPKMPLESLVYFNTWRNRLRDPTKYMGDYSAIIKRKLHTTKEAIKKPFLVDKKE